MILRPCTPKFIWNSWKGPTNPFSDKPMVRVKWTNEVQATRAERRHVWECNKPWNVAMFRRYMNVSDLQMDRCGSFSLHNSSCHVIFTSFASFFLRTHRWFDVFWWILVVQELPHTCISCGLVGKKDHFVIVVAPLWAIFLWDPHHFPRENLGLKHMKFHMTVARLHNMDWWRMRFIIWG
jgi:hypothetical protein